MKVTVIPIVIGALGRVSKGLIKRSSKEGTNYSIFEIGQNTEKSPGDLRRLSVIQPPLKNHHLM